MGTVQSLNENFQSEQIELERREQLLLWFQKLSPEEQRKQMVSLYLQRQQQRESSENFTQVGNISQNGHSLGCKLNRENFSVNTETIYDFNECKKLVINDIHNKRYERLERLRQNDSYKSLVQKADDISKEINNLSQGDGNNMNMFSSGKSFQDEMNKSARRELLTKQLSTIGNEILYLKGYDIEIQEFANEFKAKRY